MSFVEGYARGYTDASALIMQIKTLGDERHWSRPKVKEKKFEALNERDAAGKTILHYALERGDFSVIKLYGELEAPLTAISEKPIEAGKLAVDTAIAEDWNVVEVLRQGGVDLTATVEGYAFSAAYRLLVSPESSEAQIILTKYLNTSSLEQQKVLLKECELFTWNIHCIRNDFIRETLKTIIKTVEEAEAAAETMVELASTVSDGSGSFPDSGEGVSPMGSQGDMSDGGSESGVSLRLTGEADMSDGSC